MDENEALAPEDIMPDVPEDDPEEWERKRQAEWEAKIAPYKAVADANRDRDALLADLLEEVTILEIGGD